MARDLNDKTIPLTSYPSLASAPPQASQAPPQGAVFYAQPVAVPTGQPAVPYAQPIPVASAYVPTYQPYYTTEPQYVPAAQPVNPPPSPASIPPAAQPAAVPQNLRDLKNVVRTRARDGRGLHYKRYFSDAHRFTCKNFCSLLAIMLLWALMGWAVNGLIEGVTYGRRHHDRGFNWEYGTGNHGERGDDFPNQAPTVPSTTTNSSYISTPIISTSDPTYDENDSPTWQWWHKNGTDMPSFEKVFAAHKQELGRMVIFGLLQLAAVVLLWTPALAGMFLAVFNAIRTNSKIKFRDFFRCFCCRYYCKLAKLTLVLHIVKALLSLLFVIPGLWWSYVTMFAIPLHKEYPFLGVKGSIRISKLAIHGHFCRMLCFLLLLALVQVAGALCLLVGLLYTVPLAFVAFCFCFDDLIGLVPPAPLATEELVTVHV